MLGKSTFVIKKKDYLFNVRKDDLYKLRRKTVVISRKTIFVISVSLWGRWTELASVRKTNLVNGSNRQKSCIREKWCFKDLYFRTAWIKPGLEKILQGKLITLVFYFFHGWSSSLLAIVILLSEEGRYFYGRYICSHFQTQAWFSWACWLWRL